MHEGSQEPEPTATCRIARQSLAVGPDPYVTGCAQPAMGSVVDVVVAPISVVVVEGSVDVVAVTPQPTKFGSTKSVRSIGALRAVA